MSDGTSTGDAGRDEGTGSSDDQGAKFTDADMARVRRSYDGKLDKLRGELKTLKEQRSEFFSEHEVDSFDDLAERLTAQAKLDGDHADLQRKLTKAEREAKKAAAERDGALQQYQAMVATRNRAAIKDAVFAAAKKANAYEDDVYARLAVANQLGVDEDGEVVVLGKDGEPAHGVTVEKLVTQLVAEAAHLQRASPSQGGGSLPASTSGASSEPDFKERGQRIAELQNLGFGGSRRR